MLRGENLTEVKYLTYIAFFFSPHTNIFDFCDIFIGIFIVFEA